MSGGTARILVVDDHPTNRLKLQMSVRQLGYESRVAENGREALELLRQEKYDLVLLDILMPEMDGYEVLAALKADSDLRDIPVLVISALDDLEAVVKAIELGAEDHLPKTFDPILLEARVGACLEKKRLRDLEIEYLRQVEKLTLAAAAIETDGFDPADLKLEELGRREDELGRLARVFFSMAREVHAREQGLKAQIKRMRIEIDEGQQQVQVSSITGTEYFKALRDKASDLRARLHGDDDH